MFGIGTSEWIVIIILLVIIIAAIAWARKRSKSSPFEKPMVWYYFYTYFRMPIGIIIGISNLIYSIHPIHTSAVIFVLILQILLLVGLYGMKRWGWYLNIFYLFIEAIFYSIYKSPVDIYQTIIFFIIFLIFWALPNYIYFKNRFDLFKSETNGHKDYNKILPKFYKCPHCKIELELDNNERTSSKFICPNCNNSVDGHKDYNKILPKFYKCPHCKIELELDNNERTSNKFICPNCNNSVDGNEKNESLSNYHNKKINLENTNSNIEKISYCIKCGIKFFENSNYCHSCGHLIK